jgi:hypothetical protein
MAVSVVDLFEMVDVDEEYAKGYLHAAVLFKPVVQFPLDVVAVGQLGEIVEERKLLQFLNPQVVGLYPEFPTYCNEAGGMTPI